MMGTVETQEYNISHNGQENVDTFASLSSLFGFRGARRNGFGVRFRGEIGGGGGGLSYILQVLQVY